jgi:hypothetical protein
MLPIFMGTAAVVSFVLTDYRRMIQLGDGTMNMAMLVIVFCTLGEVLHHRGEDLAWSIARVLVFVEAVLLFREKESYLCWQILLISMLQTVVASVFQQSIVFGLLLLIYVFTGFCAFILIFLQQEHRYFRQHSFVRSVAETFKAGIAERIAERQDKWKIVRTAFAALFIKPLFSVIVSSRRKENSQPDLQQRKSKEILHSLFLIFPTEEDLAKSKHWENAEVLPEEIRRENAAPVSRRFPLLAAVPSFSAGTRNPHPWTGNWRELLLHIAAGTCFAFFIAGILFCLVPRIGRIDFYEFSLKSGFEHWRKPTNRPISVGTVGFREEIRLGSLGSVIPHHREVMNVAFFHREDHRIAAGKDDAEPYRAIVGQSLYFRGIPLDTYAGGKWTNRPPSAPSGNAFLRDFSDHSSFRLFDALAFPLTSPSVDVLRMGGFLSNRHNASDIQFAKNMDAVMLQMTVQPLDTPVFFAPYPFWVLREENEILLKRNAGGYLEEIQPRRFEGKKTIVCTAFKHGTQIDFVPCQERLMQSELLQIPEKGLNTLKKLAAGWDAESRLPKSDITGRARFMEQKFLQSDQFSYQLGGIVRDYDRDPLEDFIAYNPKGHCEYFAGALALMLRSVGIGTRVVIGFKTDITGTDAVCTVRQSDAHAWVEVYVPPQNLPEQTGGQFGQWWKYGGLLRLDPTPPPKETSLFADLSTGWENWMFNIQAFWNDFVLNMNSVKQMNRIYTPILHAWQFTADRIFNGEFWKIFLTGMVQYYRQLFSNFPQHQWGWTDAVYLFLPIFIFIAAGWLGWRLLSRLLLQKRMSDQRRRYKITVEFYSRMENILAKIGQTRNLPLTPKEFAAASPFPLLTFPIVKMFYQVQFGRKEISDNDRLYVQKLLKKLEEAVTEYDRTPGRH